MGIKRYVEGQGWVEIASASSSGKATQVSVTDSDELFESEDVEGVLTELAYSIKDIKSEFDNHIENHPSGGGGGGGGGSLPTITSDFEISTSDGKTDIVIPIFFTSPALGEGTAYILVNNIERKTQPIKQGNNDIIVPPVGAGKNIPITIYVKDRAGMMSNQLKWTVTAGGIEITMLTDTKADYGINDKIILSYTISCISKEEIQMHFIIDGEDNVFKAINGFNSTDLTGLAAGVHTIEYYAESGDFITNRFKFNLIVIDPSVIIISTEFDSTLEYEAGLPLSIPYRISIARDEDFTVNLCINGEVVKTLTTRPNSLYWSITSLNPGTHTLKIEAFNEALGLHAEHEFECIVIEGEYMRIQPVVDASLLCWFDATDRTNDDADRTTWTDKIRGNKGYLYNFNYGSNGWINREETNTSELVMDGTCYVEFDMAPFENNFRNGATLELVFKMRDAGNAYARILDITDTIAPFKGVYIDTQEAYLSTEAKTIHASVGEDEWIHVMYEIDRLNKYCHVIVNGVITKSCSLSDSGTGASAVLESVAHAQKMYLNSKKGIDEFGSCEVKHLRIYDRALSFDEILQNYLSTIEDINLQKTKSDFNDPLKNIMPIMNVTVDPEKLAAMTQTNKVEVSISYTSPNTDLYGETLTTATKSLMYWQGSSSIAYNVKNYTIELRDENRQPIKYSPYPNAIPQDIFCLKANLMESTNAHNVGLAGFVRKYLYSRNNPAQMADERASRTVQGFPFLLYINGELKGVYDFNLDRYSYSAYGYDLPAHAKTCRVYEISANTNTTAGAFVPWDSTKDIDEWSWYNKDFTGIYPPEIQNAVNDDFEALKTLIKFVSDSTDEVFMTEFNTHFDKESVIRYYIFVMVMGLVDSLGKNAKLVTYDGIKWYFEFYDMDTSLGLDNTGAVKYDVDIEMNPDEFNTSESRLWTRVRDLFAADIIAEYSAMRNGNLTVDKLYEAIFTDQIEKIPESQYNFSTQKKYLDDGIYIMMSNGNRYYNLKRWIRERLLYCDTLFDYSASTSSFLTIRAGTIGSAFLDIKTYSPMYITIKWKNTDDQRAFQKLKIGRDEMKRFEATGSFQIPTSKDQEVNIYGAQYIKELGSLNGLLPRHLYLNNGTRLISVECPNNPDLINIQIESCKYLQRVNLENCVNLGTLQDCQELKLGGCNNLRYVNAYGTVLKSIATNQNGGNLIEIHVPKTLQTLSLKNQYSLKVIGIPGANTLENSKVRDLQTLASNISTFSLVNCPQVERLTYSPNFTASSAFFDNYANERRANELDYLDYEKGEWKRMMSWGNGLANAVNIYIENSCHNVPSMSFRGISNLENISFRNMPGLKCLMLGANCCGYRTNDVSTQYADKLDIVHEFDWENMLTVRDCPNIEEFRIHEFYPNGYADGASGNLTYFTFKEGTNSLKLSDKFPNLKVFECNCATQNIHQIILPQSVNSVITCAWNNRHDEGFKNEWKMDKFNIDSIFFEGEHNESYMGVDLGNREMVNTRIVAPFAPEVKGVNIKNDYVNPIFNDFKEVDNEERPAITPIGKIDVSEFKWRNISDWFAFVDFTKGECDIIVPEDWDKFLENISKATKMFYYCKNPDFTWEFAMKFFPKMVTYDDVNTMYHHAILKEQESFDKDGVVLTNKSNTIGNYNFNGMPFAGSNLKYVKSLTYSAVNGAYGLFYGSNLVKIGDMAFTGTKNTGWGLRFLFYGADKLEEVGNIVSSIDRKSIETLPIDNMFEGCTSLKKIGYMDINANTLAAVYSGCESLTGEGLSLPGTKDVTDIKDAFRRCKSLDVVNFEDLGNVIFASNAFSECSDLTNVYLKGIKETSPLQDMASMFYQCENLKEVKIDGATLPAELRKMSSCFSYCKSLTKLPPLPEFTSDCEMQSCCSHCDSLTDDTIYKDIPNKVINVQTMYYNCPGLRKPVVNINTDHVIAKQMFRNCNGITELTVNFNGRLLRDSSFIADNCAKLEKVNMKFPKSLLMHEYYGTGVAYYNMFQKCPNLSVVNFDMNSLVNSNTKGDFGSLFLDTKYVKEINGLDFSVLKAPIREFVSSGDYGSYDWHDTSITYGAEYDNLEKLDIVGLLSSSYNFKNITSLKWTKEILRHLDTVTDEVIGLTYNVMDAIDDSKTEYVDPELKELALDAMSKGWTFALV